MNRKNITFKIGIILAVIIGMTVVVSFFYTPYNPETMSVTDKFLSPSLKHLMGTDNMGRDIFSRTMIGLRTSMLVASFTVAISFTTGLLIGAFAGYFGGWFDEVIMRFNDAIASFPSILLAMILISVLGRGTNTVIIALGIAFVPSYARVMRGEFLNYRNRDYVSSAKIMGAGSFRIIFRHILPNTSKTSIAAITIGFNNVILAEAGLSFLGVGIQPPTPSLGGLVSDAQAFFGLAPWYAILPGLVIVAAVLAFSFISEGIDRGNKGC